MHISFFKNNFAHLVMTRVDTRIWLKNHCVYCLRVETHSHSGIHQIHARTKPHLHHYTRDTVFILDDPSALHNRMRVWLYCRASFSHMVFGGTCRLRHTNFCFEMYWKVESKIAWQLPNSDLHCQCWQEEPAYQGTTRPRRREL